MGLDDRFETPLSEHDARIAICFSIRKLRKLKGLSQEAVAEKSGLHRTFYGNLERGLHSVSVYNLLKICGSIGCMPEEVFYIARRDFNLFA